MAQVIPTEIASELITSDNPIHQRLFKHHIVAKAYLQGDVQEVRCGAGRVVELMMQQAKSFTAVDKIEPVIAELRKEFPTGKFTSMNIPPLSGLNDNSYDSIVSFQVIEHIEDDFLYLKEIHRVLKPGGVALF